MVSSFIDALEILATESKAQKRMKFLQVETTIRSKLAQIFETLNQRRSHRINIEEDIFEDDSDSDST